MTSTPEPLPSLPPSPVETLRNEEDVGRAWHDDEPDSYARINAARKGKGRAKRNGKRRATGNGDDDEDDEDEDEDEDEGSGAVGGYPPTKEEEAESRRIQENLRRWEVAERQRRKAARESVSHARSLSRDKPINNSPSLFADLFRRDSRKVGLGGVGAHHALSTTDRDTDAVPLEELDTASVDRFSSPPTPEPENPFETPAASRTSLNIADNPAIMTESESLPAELTASPSGKKHLDVPKRPTLEASSSFADSEAEAEVKGTAKRTKSKRQPPPPKPLDLPAPKVPPPHPDIPHMDHPPEPVAEPDIDTHERVRDVEALRQVKQVEGDHPPVRWWHEWLCGCGEGPDRGGDNQAGRTNPFE
ncbi:hypothetical protein LXA43DRAFT_98626 [Ganoderma leucocontextum]|nr:hypothetical protein LXA43DRAFT_98626 [Ganoderma leucocontextum]